MHVCVCEGNVYGTPFDDCSISVELISEMCRKECWNKCVSTCNVYNIIDQNLHPCMTRTRTYDHIHSNSTIVIKSSTSWRDVSCVEHITCMLLHNAHKHYRLHTSCTKIWDGQMARVNKNHKTIKWFLPTLHRTFLSLYPGRSRSRSRSMFAELVHCIVYRLQMQRGGERKSENDSGITH